MPVKKDPSGHRSIEAEVIVPGTPEEVWAAIATGPGISAWFVPSTIEERAGGTAACDFGFGSGMESAATIKEWNPPHSYVSETEMEPLGRVATQWIVEARGGGTCLVRVVHRWFASTDEWDNQFEGHAYGWGSFFRNLKLYLTHFRGRRCATVALSAMCQAPMARAWRTATDSLALSGDDPNSPPFGPADVVHRRDDHYSELQLRLNGPTPGIVHLFPMPMGEQTMIAVRVYLYGDRAGAGAEKAQREWGAWLAGRFPQEAAG